ncbi:MAG: ABC transporter ATP-binding protein [Methylobacterium mesophilicum]|nr:ABC transporter ATP-binding protein [Methylobacterium mesophilicum]
MARIALSGLSKRFGATHAVDDLTLAVESGDFLALLGPSGCGKTTVLRLIAGLERPDAGTIRIDDRLVAGGGTFVEPEDRRLGMMFQSYALWPHMTVGRNVGFGLHGRGLSRPQIEARVRETLEVVGLAARMDAKPHQLSGGQRQRVALARCLAMRPKLILLDEPLANLDAGLRASMAAEFRRIHAETGATFVVVTHDQNEAMALATRVAMMDAGRLQQVASPEELWRRPASPAVARFVGNGRLLPVEVLGSASGPSGLQSVRCADAVMALPGAAPVGPGLVCVRPEGISIVAEADDPASLSATVRDGRFEGGAYLLDLALAASPEPAVVQARHPRALPAGSRVAFRITDGWVMERKS